MVLNIFTILVINYIIVQSIAVHGIPKKIMSKEDGNDSFENVSIKENV